MNAVSFTMAKHACLALAAAAAAGCSDPGSIGGEIQRQFEQSGRRFVDLNTAVPGSWQQVCIIGPYMTNAQTHATLGFAWDSEKVSGVALDDSIVLLVFVDAGKVTSFTNYRRGNGDFSNLRGRCFARSEARFEQVGRPSQGWPGLFPQQ